MSAPALGALALVTLVVADYDAAVAWYRGALGFIRHDDVDLGDGKRWVTVGPAGGGGARFLAEAATQAQRTRIGDQTGGRVAFFLHTDDFARDHARMLAAGVRFREAPRREAYGTVAVFEDLYGNLFDLVEPRRG